MFKEREAQRHLASMVVSRLRQVNCVVEAFPRGLAVFVTCSPSFVGVRHRLLPLLLRVTS